jgi:hypothetical protein
MKVKELEEQFKDLPSGKYTKGEYTVEGIITSDFASTVFLEVTDEDGDTLACYCPRGTNGLKGDKVEVVGEIGRNNNLGILVMSVRYINRIMKN